LTLASDRFVPNFPQPQPCWPLSTQGPHPTLLDGESRWWCCGISLRYAWRRHLAREGSAAPLAEQVRGAHRERGSLGAGRGPASLNGEQQRFSANYHGHHAGSRPVVTNSLGPGGRGGGGNATPSPSSPALVIRTDVHDRRMMTEDITGHVVRIRRAFDAAFQRMCEAKNPEAAEDELSNLLCQLYRLSELVKHEFGDPTRFHDALRATPDHCAARAAMWVRNFDTHQTVVVADMGDSFTDYFTEMFGTLVWRPLADLPEQRSNYGRADYDAQLAGQPVLDTARRAFDTLAAMV